MKSNYTLISLLVGLFLFASCKPAAIDHDKFLTDYEKSGFTRTPRYAETVEYSKLLADNSKMINYKTIGLSPQGREISLLIVDKDGLTSAEAIRKRGRAVVLAEANIHAGEPDGKDAGFMFIRDMVYYDKFPGMLDNVSLLFIPIINVDGHEDFGEHYRINQNGPVEVGARFTAQRYNMNRDFIKADALETQLLLSLYSEWMPELFIDIHVTNGADFQYMSTYGLDMCGFLPPNMLDWSMNIFEKELKERMAGDGFPIFPYFSMRNMPDKGVVIFPSSFAPQYSNGYACANNRIGLLIENHIYKPYKDRVDATYLYLKNSMEIVGERHKELIEQIRIADNLVSSKEFRRDSLSLDYIPDMRVLENVEYLAWEQQEQVSDLSGAKWTTYNYDAPITEHYLMNISYTGAMNVLLPEAYIVPSEQIETISLLDIHGVNYSRLEKDEIFDVVSYHFTDSEWSRFPYEGRSTVQTKYNEVKERLDFHRGDVYVSMAQPKAKIIAHLLEPKSPTSLVYWGFYNNFVRAPSEFYIRLNYMEFKGREMMEKDPALKAEFEKKLKEDKAFAADPNARLNFFMTLVREQVGLGVNRYPVAKIY